MIKLVHLNHRHPIQSTPPHIIMWTSPQDLLDSWTHRLEHDFTNQAGEPAEWAPGHTRAARWPGEEAASAPLPGEKPTSNVTISSNGKLVAVASHTTIAMYEILIDERKNVTIRETRTLRGHAGDVTRVDFHPDGRLLASCSSREACVRLWDLEAHRGQEQEGQVVIRNVHEASLGSHLFSAEGSMLFYGQEWRTEDGERRHTAVIYDVQERRERARLEGHTDAIMWIGSSPDSQRVATSSWDKTVRVWDAMTGAELRTLRGAANQNWAAAWSPDGRFIAAGCGDKSLRVWNVESGDMQHELKGFNGWVRTVAFIEGTIGEAEGESETQEEKSLYLAAGAAGATVRLFDMRTGECVGYWQAKVEGQFKTLEIVNLRSFPRARGGGSVLAFGNTDGRMVVYDGRRNVKWEFEQDRGAGREEKPALWRTAFGISPDGRMMLSAHADGTLRAWNLVYFRQ